MRVLHVLEVSVGGTVSVLNSYARGQVEAGDEVHVLAPDDAVITSGVRHSWAPARRSPQRFPQAVRDLRALVDSLEPDVVHLHSFFPGLLGRVRPFRQPNRPAVVYQPHSWAFDAAPTALGRLLVATWERFAARRTDAFVVNCTDELDEGRRHRVTATAHVVGVPVDVRHFRLVSDEERRRVRNELGLDDQRVLVCIGRLSRQKGQDRLVSAWERSPIRGTSLVLVGGGDPEPYARLAPTEWGRSIKAVGAVPDVRPWLHAADLAVMPSRYEGQSVGMAEALACGRPVVATRVNGALEAIEDGPEASAGVVVDQHDVGAFLAACRRRLDDPSLLAVETVAARRRAERQFAEHAVLSRVRGAYVQACSEVASLTDAEHRP